MKTFTTTGICIPDENYMVNLDERIQRIREMVDRGSYFTIHCARQYGKSTTLHLLECSIQTEFYVISLDFQGIGDAGFQIILTTIIWTRVIS